MQRTGRIVWTSEPLELKVCEGCVVLGEVDLRAPEVNGIPQMRYMTFIWEYEDEDGESFGAGDYLE